MAPSSENSRIPSPPSTPSTANGVTASKHPLLDMLKTILDMSILEGKSAEEINSHFFIEGKFWDEHLIDEICTPERPAIVPEQYITELYAKYFIAERLSMFELILGLDKQGKSTTDIKKICSEVGYRLDWYVEDLVSIGRLAEKGMLGMIG
ncbi:hypothetical protein MMC07_003044 [Pseudocyphellaria aurata]|nr:hypothetical protein [Pseudocyphellaria aurata]